MAKGLVGVVFNVLSARGIHMLKFVLAFAVLGTVVKELKMLENTGTSFEATEYIELKGVPLYTENALICNLF